MPTLSIETILSQKTGYSHQEIFKILCTLGDIIKEEVYENGNFIAIPNLGLFKQQGYTEDGQKVSSEVESKESLYYKLEFVATPDMNNGNWAGWIWQYQQ